jgi:menaquinol-cytochrome c reductase iron-sulfur subunit
MRDTAEESAERSEKIASPARRSLLVALSAVLGTLAAIIVGIPVVGFVLAPALRRRGTAWRSVGPVESFKVGETVQVTFENASSLPWGGVADKSAAWLRRQAEEEFVAFSVNCAHLGCAVRWMPDANLFMCPCHGGVYYSNGDVAGGPPPRPLFRYQVRLRAGYVEVQAAPIPMI